MRRSILIITFLVLRFCLLAQPTLVNTSAYAPVSTIAYDSLTNRIYYNLLYGCTTWNIPCAYSYTAAMNNIINKHYYYDNTVSTVNSSSFQVGPPSYPVNNMNSATSRQALCKDGSIFTNFGYYFNKIDTFNLSATWSYSPSSSYKEISVFEIKSDSVFMFVKDSTTSKNYYTVIVKNKLTGNTIAFPSINASTPASNSGAIEGYIRNSFLAGNSIILSGVFTASISGAYIARNLVSLNISTGQLQIPTSSFAAGTSVYDMKEHNNKLYAVGSFSSVSSQFRNHLAVFDYSLNLLPETCHFNNVGSPAATWVDNIVFYDKYLIAKGNYSQINNTTVAATNSYVVKAIDITNGTVMPWSINLPGTPQLTEYTYQIVKYKLYIKNRSNNGSPFNIYCFEPVQFAANILFQNGSGPQTNICAPDSGYSNIYTAPIKYAENYNWTFSGTNATVVPIGNGNKARLNVGPNGTSGILTVSGTNDCGLSSPSITLNISINPKPTFTLPASPQIIICNPDSTLLQGISSGSVNSISWRKSGSANYKSQPFYVTTPGNYYMVVANNSTGCKDSNTVLVKNFKANPNAKIVSHIYPGPFTPIDTVTCYQPTVNIIAASDTSGVVITWKSIPNNSVYPNPINMSSQASLKVIATRTINACVDSSLILLVGQNNTIPSIAFPNYNSNLNCSIYSTTVNAVFTPSNCSAIWTGPTGYNSLNPAIIDSAGFYYVTATNTINGCVKTSSALINYNPVFQLNISRDTVICKESVVTLTALTIGTLSSVSYTWSNGMPGNNIIVTPTITQEYIVAASGPGECYGSDTILVAIPPDIQDSIVTSRSCSNNNTGNIVVYISGGIFPYSYSINNGNTFSSVNTFTGIPFGNYNIVIKDSLGCIKSASTEITANSALPVPAFLASTQNYINDTIVLIDISIPKADSIQWVLPTQATIIGGDIYNRIITLNDTGSVIITMKGFYGNCIINATKTIKFLQTDTIHATNSNANGIKTFSVYPNPSNGEFTAFVEFYKKQNACIQVWNTGSLKYFQQNFYNTDTIDLPVNLGQLQNGSYILRVIGEYDSRNKIFIISK